MTKAMLRPYPEYQDSRLSWLGRIPVGWKVRRFRYLLDEVDDRSNDGRETLLSVSQYTGVTPRQKRADGSVETRSASLVGYKKASAGDLVVNIMLAWNGSLGIAPVPGIVSPAYAVYRARKDVHPTYIHYLLRTELYKSRIRASSTGVVESRLRLYTDDLYDIEAVLPPVETQRQIAQFLQRQDWRFDRLIRAKQRLIALLNEQKQAIIQRAVTRGLDPDVRLKPSGVEWLGEVPEHWEVAPLKIFADIRISGVDKHSVPGEIEIRLCNYTDVYHQDFIDSSHEFMWATATPKEIEAFELRRGDVIITKDSETWDDIAVPAVVTEDLHGVVCGYHLALIRPSKQVEGEFLLRALQAPIIASQFHVAATGVTRYGLSKHSIKSAVIPLPPLSEQQAIIESVRQQVFVSDETADRARREIKFLREYRTRLIADVVTGKLDVRGVDVPDAGDQEELFEAEIPGEEEHLSMQEAM